jgi:hypothetical protein
MMKKSLQFLKMLCVASALLIMSAPNLYAQEDDKFSMSVSLNSDVFFGYYPFFQGAYKLNDKMSFTFYGIQWSGGTGAAWGNWTEFGAGVSLPMGAFTVTPQIGLLNGSLTSGLGAPRLGEGFVPNLTVGYNTDKIFGEFYGGFYVGLDKGNPTTNNYLHYWLTGGYKLSSLLTVGLHFEHLRFEGGKGPAEPFDYYMSLGPYVQLSDPKGNSFVRFTTGGDLRSDAEVAKSGRRQPEFFKLALGFNL